MSSIIKSVEEGGLLAGYGINPGDSLIEINGNPVNDIFDYRYLLLDTKLTVKIKRQSGDITEIKLNKDEYEDLGLNFNSGLMDNAKSCSNKCIFCFIDQLPKNMRKSLYFKDDDSRLSFLHGNYVTLTNMSNTELERIAYYHLSPINISVHSTDPELRAFMLKNPAAANIAEQLETLRQANISMNFQIVLCKNVNDGAQLEKTISDLGRLMPYAQSLSVVPAGLSDFRDGLCQIDSFTKQDAREIIAMIENKQKCFYKETGTRFVYAADEFYLKANSAIPENVYYEDFPQIENGVGMLRSFIDEFEYTLKKSKKACPKRQRLSIVTSEAAYKHIDELIQKFMNIHNNVEINVFDVCNNFFGKSITVSGLMTGKDILARLKDCEPGERVLIPANALRSDDMIFLDDLTLSDLESEIGVPVLPVRISGSDLVNELLGL